MKIHQDELLQIEKEKKERQKKLTKGKKPQPKKPSTQTTLLLGGKIGQRVTSEVKCVKSPSRRMSQDDYVQDAVRKYLAEDHSPKELLKEQCKRMGNFVK